MGAGLRVWRDLPASRRSSSSGGTSSCSSMRSATVYSSEASNSGLPLAAAARCRAARKRRPSACGVAVALVQRQSQSLPVQRDRQGVCGVVAEVTQRTDSALGAYVPHLPLRRHHACDHGARHYIRIGGSHLLTALPEAALTDTEQSASRQFSFSVALSDMSFSFLVLPASGAHRFAAAAA